MVSHAIVVGIDAYERPEWKLSAAVADALRFARWALDHGGVAPENLALLLSPEPGTTVDLPYEAATRGKIEDAITPFLRGRADGDDRLYVYCAGHGVSAPGVTAGGVQQPVLIPADVTSLEDRSYLLLGFSDLIPRLLDAGPREHFFFIDACRDFALEQDYTSGVGAFSGRWRPPNPKPGARRSQYVLYATAPGLQSYEKKVAGRGVFATALVDALSGARPAATRFSGGQWQLTFATLAKDVHQQVKRQLEMTKAKDAERYVQTPQPEVIGESPDTVLATFERMPKIPVSVKVTPRNACTTGNVRLLYPIPGVGDTEISTLGPPVKSISRFQVSPGDYVLAVKADRFRELRHTTDIYEPKTVPLVLEPDEAPETRNERSALRPAPLTSLRVECDDPAATVVILDSGGAVVERTTGSLAGMPVDPGIYRVQLLVPEGVADQETVEVREGHETRVTLRPEPPDIGPASMKAFGAVGIDVSTGYVHPAEHLGSVASPSLASLLGFAAFASHWPDVTMFRRLRKVGVPALTDLGPDESGVLLLVGADGDHPVPGIGPEALLAAGELLVRYRHGAVVHRSRVEPLAGMATVAQAHARVAPGPLVLEVSLPGAAPTRYAVVALRSRVTTLVIVANQHGGFDVHQYLIPVGPQSLPYEFLTPDSIRAIDLAQRYYTEGKLLPGSDHLAILLDGKWLDPLLACIAGYSLASNGDIERYAGNPIREAAPDEPEPSAMRNMLKFFDELPDSHVLAGLCQPAERGRHFANALDRGLPVFADGIRALHEWYRSRGQVPPVLAEPARRSIPGSPWTAWTAARPALVVRGGAFEAPPVGWEGLTRHREAIEGTLRGSGKVLLGTGMQTGFLVGERLVLTSFFGSDFVGRPEPASIDFAYEDGRPPDDVDRWHFDIVREVRRDAEGMLALLEIADRSRGGEPAPPPLTLSAERPSPLDASEVYIIGHPHPEAGHLQPDPGRVARVFGPASGVKRVQPGAVLGFGEQEQAIRHDCFTLPGDAGACLVHVESGKVIGIHHSASATGDPHKQGVARALWPLRKGAFFKGSGAEFG